MLTNKIFNASALRKPISSAAQQVLCACISAVMRSSNTCCASGYQLMGDELLDISSVYVYERAVNGLDTYKKYSPNYSKT